MRFLRGNTSAAMKDIEEEEIESHYVYRPWNFPLKSDKKAVMQVVGAIRTASWLENPTWPPTQKPTLHGSGGRCVCI